MSWQIFFTAFALLACAISSYAAWRALEHARAAAHSEHRLAIMRGQVAGLCTSIEVLDDKHKRLAGRVYADEYWRGKRDDQAELVPQPSVGDPCPKWAQAKVDGPLSAAAKCECAYCDSQRAQRAAARATFRREHAGKGGR